MIWFAMLPIFIAASDRPVVQLENVKIVGIRINQHEEFRGIPYARADRWRLPETVVLEPGSTFDAGFFGPHCYQGQRSGAEYIQMTKKLVTPPKDPQPSERDCLNLNILRPIGTPPAQGWPVEVSIHGGIFAVGSNHRAGDYPDVSMDTMRSTLVVKINYRVNAFGFALIGIVGNFGLHDQIAAFRWVQANIDSFGGNPGQVCITGYSAGSMAVQHLMLLVGHDEKLKGLFHRAIMQSGTTQTLPLQTLDDARNVTRHLAAALGCPIENTNSMEECLRGMSADEIVKVIQEKKWLFCWGPVRDGSLIDYDPVEAMAAGRFHRVPVLLTFIIDDASLYLPFIGRQDNPEYGKMLSKNLTEPEKVLSLYPLAEFGGSGSRQAIRMATDSFFRAPMYQVWLWLQAQGVPSVFYRLTAPFSWYHYYQTADYNPLLGHHHTCDKVLLDGHALSPDHPCPDREPILRMRQVFTRFIAKGELDPNALPSALGNAEDETGDWQARLAYWCPDSQIKIKLAAWGIRLPPIQ